MFADIPMFCDNSDCLAHFQVREKVDGAEFQLHRRKRFYKQCVKENENLRRKYQKLHKKGKPFNSNITSDIQLFAPNTCHTF